MYPCRYLYEFLYGWLSSALNNVESIMAEQEAANAGNSNNSGSGGGGRRAPRPPRHKKRPTPRPSQHEALMCQIMQNLCGGYYKVIYFIHFTFFSIVLHCLKYSVSVGSSGISKSRKNTQSAFSFR